MSERTSFPSGVPCWVDIMRTDPAAAATFYAGLFGWQIESRRTHSGSRDYLVGTLRGRDVAGIATAYTPHTRQWWNTYVLVDRVDVAAARALDAGGVVLSTSAEAFDGGSIAVLADPAGAVIHAWQPSTHGGAQLVNEPGAWAMSVLRTDDPRVATGFYGDLFGWTAEPFGDQPNAPLMWRLPGYVGGEPEQPVPRDVVAVMTPIEATASSAATTTAQWDVNFWVSDVDAVAAKATELGGAVVAAPTEDASGFREAVVSDPVGATISVSQLLTES